MELRQYVTTGMESLLGGQVPAAFGAQKHVDKLVTTTKWEQLKYVTGGFYAYYN